MPRRIISLLPAATEIICALGLENNLVGRSHECDYPESVKQLPVCTKANLPDNLSSNAIDIKVKEILADALSVYTVNRELIKQLMPDVIITQAQCKACAVSLTDVEAAMKNYLNHNVQVLSLQPVHLKDIFSNFSMIADELGAAGKGFFLLEDLQERVNIIQHKLKYIENKPAVACIEWLEPLMIAGNWTPELVQIAGGTSVLAEPGKPSFYTTWEYIRSANPDLLIIMPCGFPIERTLKEMDLLLQLPGFGELKAVKSNRVYIADGNQFFNRPGPRIVDSIEILAEIIHPKQFIFGYEGEGWIKFAL